MKLKILLMVIVPMLLFGCDRSGSEPQQVTYPDSDNDGLTDITELKYGLNPNDPSDGYYADNDGDLIVNGLEIANDLDLPDYHRASASLSNRSGIGAV